MICFLQFYILLNLKNWLFSSTHPSRLITWALWCRPLHSLLAGLWLHTLEELLVFLVFLTAGTTKRQETQIFRDASNVPMWNFTLMCFLEHLMNSVPSETWQVFVLDKTRRCNCATAVSVSLFCIFLSVLSNITAASWFFSISWWFYCKGCVCGRVASGILLGCEPVVLLKGPCFPTASDCRDFPQHSEGNNWEAMKRTERIWWGISDDANNKAVKYSPIFQLTVKSFCLHTFFKSSIPQVCFCVCKCYLWPGHVTHFKSF